MNGDASIILLDLSLPQETLYLSEVAYDRYEPLITKGGISEISAFVSRDSTTIPTCEVTVTVSDKGGRLQKLLEGAYDCRRSVAVLNRWTPDGTFRKFTGILKSWDFNTDQPVSATLHLQTDDSVLQYGWVPHLTILAAEWTEGSYTMPTDTPGLCVPYLYGSHNSSGITGKGFVPLICVGQSGSTGRYLVCWHRALSKIGTWKEDGTSLTGTVEYVTRGGKTFTTVKFASGITAGLKVNGDFTGYDSVGDGTGELIGNPVHQLRHLLNVVYADQRAGLWVTSDVAPIHAESWAAAAAWCDTYKLEGSAHFGGTTDKIALSQVIERWLNSFPVFRLAWNEYGQLVMVNLADAIAWPGYPTASSRLISAQSERIEKRTKVTMDMTGIARQITASYLYSATDGQAQATIDVQDPTVIEKVTTSIQMDWSLARVV